MTQEKSKLVANISDELSDFEIISVKLSDLILNEYDPNIMSPPEYEYLKASIKKYGYLTPILVCEHEGKYFVADGAHRVLALKEEARLNNKNEDEIYITVIKPKKFSLAEAWSGAFLFNKAKGKLSPKKVAEFLLKGEEMFGLEKILEATNIPKQYYEEYVATLKAGGKEVPAEVKKELVSLETIFKPEQTTEQIKAKIIETEKEIKAKEETLTNVLFVAELPMVKYKFVMDTLSEISENVSEALIMLCEFYLANKNAFNEFRKATKKEAK
jgi:hypothetical protein